MIPIIVVDNLTVSYENKPEVLKDVSLTIYEKDFLGIIGPNGGGKTTLLKTILGLKPYDSGKIAYYDNGVEVPSLNVGYLPQMSQVDKKFPIEVHDVVLSGLTRKRGLFSRYSKEDKQKVVAIAQRMGIESMLNRPIGDLSGGQLQRVLLARAIIDKPKVLILDEPSTFVDKVFEKSFYKLLGEINEEISIVLVSHDVGTILPLIKNIACVNKSLHYHSGSDISQEWLTDTIASCPIEILGHGLLPHRVLMEHDSHD
ncbi:MAG: metal ABC transporter ATP-binding protein [Fermentimonas sp.]|jgi:zinc transport system ATP-binding protein